MKTFRKIASIVILPILFGCIIVTFTSPSVLSGTRLLTLRPLSNSNFYKSIKSYVEHKSLDLHSVDQNLSVWKQIPSQVDDGALNDARITVTPPLVANGGVVTVEWVRIPEHDHGNKDWIGLFCPSHAPSSHVIDFWWVRELVNVTQEHSARFVLYNVRSDCQFRYYIVDDTMTKLVAVSNKIHFVDSRKAHLHIHLALTGNPQEMRVQWTTGHACVPTVHYGTSPESLHLTATGVSRSYKASDMCGPPANQSAYFIDPGYLHDVLLTDLDPNSRYFYQVSGTGISSETKTFQTSLQPGSDPPFSFIVYGDMDISSHSHETAARVLTDIQNRSSFVLHIGDLSYAIGLAYRWDEWMTLIEPCSSRVPYMVSVGNHEQCHIGDVKKDPSGNSFHPAWGNYRHDSGGECGVPTSRRFHMPDNGNGVWWYSFKYGLAHIIQVSTEHSLAPGSIQFSWLEQELRSVDRGLTPWLIVTGHRPMYNSEMYIADYNVSVHLRKNMEELLHEHRVDLYAAGHYHSYERVCTVYRDKCIPDGIVHVTVGSAGMHLDSAPRWDFSWSKHFEHSHGYGRVTVANRSALLWEFVRNKDGNVSDHVWLTK